MEEKMKRSFAMLTTCILISFHASMALAGEGNTDSGKYSSGSKPEIIAQIPNNRIIILSDDDMDNISAGVGILAQIMKGNPYTNPHGSPSDFMLWNYPYFYGNFWGNALWSPPLPQELQHLVPSVPFVYHPGYFESYSYF
jgi:hypothetical protein